MRESAFDAVHLVDQFGGGVAAVLRRHAGMGGAALDLMWTCGALAPDGEHVRRIARLHVEFHVVLRRQRLDQLGGAGRAALLAGLEQQA